MEKLTSFAGKLILYIWFALTIIVILLLIIRVANPGVKGISNYDLKNYAKVSLIFAVIYFVLKFLNRKTEQKIELNRNRKR